MTSPLSMFSNSELETIDFPTAKNLCCDSSTMQTSLSFSNSENLRGTFQLTQRSAEDLKKALGERARNASGKGADALNAAQAQIQNLANQLVNIEKLIDAAEIRPANV